MSQKAKTGVILLCIQDDALLLQQRATNDELHSLYAPVAGKMDIHESPTEAIIREAKEEAGILLALDDLTLSCVVHWTNRRGDDVVEFYFTCSNFSGTPQVVEPDKAFSIGFHPLNDLPDNLVSAIRPVLSAIDNNVFYLEWNGELIT